MDHFRNLTINQASYAARKDGQEDQKPNRLMVGIVVFAANTICVYYMERYTLPVFVSAVFALLIAVASLARRRAG